MTTCQKPHTQPLPLLLLPSHQQISNQTLWRLQPRLGYKSCSSSETDGRSAAQTCCNMVGPKFLSWTRWQQRQNSICGEAGTWKLCKPCLTSLQMPSHGFPRSVYASAAWSDVLFECCSAVARCCSTLTESSVQPDADLDSHSLTFCCCTCKISGKRQHDCDTFMHLLQRLSTYATQETGPSRT